MNCIDRLFRKSRKKTPPFTPTVLNSSDLETIWQQEILRIINKERGEAGLDPFYLEETCQSVADKRIERMVRINGTSHSMLAEDSAVLKKHGLTVAELQAYQYSAPESVVNGWMDSDSHHKVLFGDYNYIGVGFDVYSFYVDDRYVEDAEFCSLILIKA